MSDIDCTVHTKTYGSNVTPSIRGHNHSTGVSVNRVQTALSYTEGISTVLSPFDQIKSNPAQPLSLPSNKGLQHYSPNSPQEVFQAMVAGAAIFAVAPRCTLAPS